MALKFRPRKQRARADSGELRNSLGSGALVAAAEKQLAGRGNDPRRLVGLAAGSLADGDCALPFRGLYFLHFAARLDFDDAQRYTGMASRGAAPSDE
jgi:hypothetical protein